MSGVSTPYYRALDFALIFIACSVAYKIRFDTFSLPLYYFLPATIFATVSTFALSTTNFYQATNSGHSAKQSVSAISGLIVAAIATIACLYLTKTGEAYSRIWLVSSVILAFFAVVSLRIILNKVFHISMGSRTIVLLGQGQTAEVIGRKIDSSPNNNTLLAATFSIDQPGSANSNKTQLIDVAKFIEKYRNDRELKSPITEVWITYDVFSRFQHYELENAFSNTSVRLVYIPELPNLEITNDDRIELVSGVPTINSSFSKNQKLKSLIKLIEDQMIAWISIILLTPLMLIIALLIKLESRGPVFYKQARYGFGGKGFEIWKFRTMQHSESGDTFKQAQKNDPRITNFGRLLRRSSLDELAQLFNVVNGTMSIVGPRPHPEELNEQYRTDIDNYMYRHTFKPGITGLAQIRGFRGETIEPEAMRNRIKYDIEYIRNWSLALDVKILFLTVTHLFTTDKAH